MVADWVRYGSPKVLGIATGAVAGLVAITPACGYVGPLGAAMIGLAAGFVCFTVTNIVKQNFKLDDSLDVFAVHGIGGALGTLLTGVFAAEAFGGVGLRAGSIGEQLAIQGAGILAVYAWTALVTVAIIKGVGFWLKVRVSEEEERMGLDLSQHEESGYHME